MNIQDIAKAAHEINNAYCISIGEAAKPDWDAAPEWQRNSIINGVIFHIENPDALVSAGHENWLKQKTEEGWRYGPIQDNENKIHPCFLPYDELPAEQKSKDFLFKQIVASLKGFIPAEEETPAIEPETAQGNPNLMPGEPANPEPLSFGMKAVGITFNPSGHPGVYNCKNGFAWLIDQMNDLRSSSKSDSQKRYASTAITQMEMSQMIAVKALTWQD